MDAVRLVSAYEVVLVLAICVAAVAPVARYIRYPDTPEAGMFPDGESVEAVQVRLMREADAQ